MGLRNRKVRLDQTGRGVERGEELLCDCFEFERTVDLRVWLIRWLGSKARVNVYSTYVAKAKIRYSV